MTWLALWLWTLSAGAAEFYVEGPVHEVRADAIASSRAARDAGHQARVVRRYRDGAGWEYLVRVSGFTQKDTAIQATATLGDLLGGEVALFELPEEDAEPVRVMLGERSPAAPIDVAVRVSSGEREPPAPVAPTVEAHGGAEGGVARISRADAVLFRFTRRLPGGEVIEHTWARHGEDLYAEVKGIEGEVTSSRTLVTADGAWLAVGDGTMEAKDRERAVEVVEALAPDKVIPFVLSFAALAEERNELTQLVPAGEDEVDGKQVRVLRSDGEKASGPLVLRIDPRTALVRRVDFDDGVMVVQFDDWKIHASAAVRIPAKVRTWREGELVDTVEIHEIDLEPELPKAWFQAP